MGKQYVFKSFINNDGTFSKEDTGAGDVYVIGFDPYGNVLTTPEQAEAPRWGKVPANMIREAVSLDKGSSSTIRVVHLVTKAIKLARKAKKSLAENGPEDAVVFVQARDDKGLTLPQMADAVLDILAAAGIR